MMDKNTFKDFCKEEFYKRGFVKMKNIFYLKDEEVLCGIDLQRSNYGNEYYVNYWFCIGKYEALDNYPTYYDSDIEGRITVLSKNLTYEKKHFMTTQIEIERYTEEELKLYFDEAFEKEILPPIYQGKKYILDNLNKLYYLTLRQNEVMRKLQE